MTEEQFQFQEISLALPNKIIGRRILHYPTLASTMSTARWHIKQGTVEGTVIIADEQTLGRGRVKRGWLSPKGSISLSIIISPPLSRLHYLTMVSALAVYHSLKQVTGLEPELKWPNDVLIKRKKVCGILLESDVRGGRVAYAIIGIGINANRRVGDFPEIPAVATSLLEETGREVPRWDIIRSLLQQFESLYLRLDHGDKVFQEWQRRLSTLGQRVQVTSGSSNLIGIAESVDPDGSLILRHDDGNVARIIAGDVTLRSY
ncbi:biotin--[acetyl-CoA-carboxylase] ligase [Chloroflexota bacterium]